jgi:hypothetical protein
VKLQGCAHELSQLAVITAQFALGLAVGEVKVFQTGEFNLEFLDLFEGEMRVAGVGFAPENLADEKREVAAVRGHGTVQDLAGQAVAQLAARDQAFRVAASMGAPRDEGSVLLPRGATITEVAVGENRDDFRVVRLALQTALFVTIAEDVSVESHGREIIRFRLFGKLAWKKPGFHG